MHLSALLRLPLTSQSGEEIGRLDDVIVRLRGGDHPIVLGLVARIGRRRVHLPLASVSRFTEAEVVLSEPVLDLRSFERRPGEVLLRGDIMGHRLIDVAEAHLVRARDLELRPTDGGYLVCGVDTSRRPSVFRRGARRGKPVFQDWKSFEALIGHRASALARLPTGRLGRLRPAQIADLLEDASSAEGEEILDAVHANPELEADVFEELDPELATRLLGDKTDVEIADVLNHMRADDAADALAELAQERRQPVLDLLAPPNRVKILALLGFNPATAGGLMGMDYLTARVSDNVSSTLGRVGEGTHMQPEAITSIYTVDENHLLTGSVSLVGLLQSGSKTILEELIDPDPVRVLPKVDVVDLALLMADYNLITIPVVDETNRLLGVVTVDDVLEATIPDDWRRREPAAHPEPTAHPEPASAPGPTLSGPTPPATSTPIR